MEPTLLLMGLRRGGKSSIRQVVFHDMQPLETLYLESTSKPVVEHLDSLVRFHLEEVPGQHDMAPEELAALFSTASSIIFVIDSQDEYLLALQSLVQIVEQAHKANKAIHIEALIHKIDGLNEDFRQDAQRDIVQRVTEELVDVGIVDADITFHLTSIFDHSVIEAFSRILQKLVPKLSALTQLLDFFCQQSSVEKVFLFDARSKVYLATDSSPVDLETYQICSDYIDVAIDLASLYAGADIPRLSSTSTLQNGVVIYLAQMIKGLLLVGLARDHSPQHKTLVESNLATLRSGLANLYP